MTKDTINDIGNALITLSAAISTVNFHVVPEEIIDCLEGELIDEEEAGNIREHLKQYNH